MSTPSALEAQLPPPRPCLASGTAGFTPRARAGWLLTVAGSLLLACSGGDGLLLPSEGQPAAIEVLRGDGQSGRVGEPLADPLVVQVTDTRNRPVEGATVTFELTSGGPGADVVPHTATTDANGQANAQIVLGTTIGQQTGEARLAVGAAPPKTTFTAIAVSENANKMAAVAGEDQTGHVGAPLAEPLVVQVTDAFGNPIAGVPISWEAEGGGTVSDAIVNTDGQGRASVERVLGPAAGQQTTVATSQGLAGSPVTFVHTALAGNASHLAVVSGDNQTGQVGSQLPAELVVRLIDGDGNGVPNTAVAWVVAIGGGSVTPTSSNTDSDGRASARWTLGGAPGANRLDAVVSGVGVVTFDATATAGAPAALSIVTQPSSSARNGQPFDRQPVIQLRDAAGNPVPRAGIQVSAAIGAGSGELTGTRQRSTDANGQAAFTDLAIIGSGRHTLVFSSSGYASRTSSDIDVGSISTTTTITSDAPDPSTSGSAFPVEFRVTSGGPTPTGNVTVTVSDGGATCSGTLSGGAGSCQLTLTKTGDRTLQAAYSGAPGFDPSSDTEGHRVDPVGPGNQAPHAEFEVHCTNLDCSFTNQSTDPDGTIAGSHWDFGDGQSSSDPNPSHSYAAPGKYQVTLTVTDNGGATDSRSHNADASASTTVTITADAPDPSDFAAPITVSFTVTSSGGSPSGSVVVTDPIGGTCTGNAPSDSCTLTPAGSGTRTLTATYQGNSSFSGSSGTADHTVNPPPPAATTTTITGHSPDPSDFAAPITVSFTVTSSGGTPSGTVVVTDAIGGSCTGNAPSDSCTLTPAGSGTRTLTATYQGNSSFSGSSGTAEHTVKPPNQAPSAMPDTYSTPHDVALTVGLPGVLANDTDPDGDALTALLVSSTANGNLSLQGDGSFTYTPNAGFTGADSFSYMASDGSLSSTATVTITVIP